MVQYFSLTIKQSQPAYKPQKQPAEQGEVKLRSFVTAHRHSYPVGALGLIKFQTPTAAQAKVTKPSCDLSSSRLVSMGKCSSGRENNVTKKKIVRDQN
jgi:hypothetical protein